MLQFKSYRSIKTFNKKKICKRFACHLQVQLWFILQNFPVWIVVPETNYMVNADNFKQNTWNSCMYLFHCKCVCICLQTHAHAPSTIQHTQNKKHFNFTFEYMMLVIMLDTSLSLPLFSLVPRTKWILACKENLTLEEIASYIHICLKVQKKFIFFSFYFISSFFFCI